MNNELVRFFKSINFSDEVFNDAILERVVLKKNDKKFIVYIKNKEVLPIKSVNNLFLCAMNGINGDKKCDCYLTYDMVKEEDIVSYLDYLLDEIIIRRPSLVSIKKSRVEVLNDTIYFHVLNEFLI